MPDLLSPSILCPILIGRDTQVATLARLLELARVGHSQIALISGEAREPFRGWAAPLASCLSWRAF